MEIDKNFWLLFVANLPVVVALFIALQKGWVVMGRNHLDELTAANKEIEFREKLRQEALADKQALQVQNTENQKAMKELTVVVQNSLELNERLVNEGLEKRWDGNDRRP